MDIKVLITKHNICVSVSRAGDSYLVLKLTYYFIKNLHKLSGLSTVKPLIFLMYTYYAALKASGNLLGKHHAFQAERSEFDPDARRSSKYYIL